MRSSRLLTLPAQDAARGELVRSFDREMCANAATFGGDIGVSNFDRATDLDWGATRSTGAINAGPGLEMSSEGTLEGVRARYAAHFARYTRACRASVLVSDVRGAR